jgi:predicted Fe-Mo cluster-binding NifX family protein
MKIAVTTTSPDITAEIDPRFGRGANFLIIDADTQEWRAVANPGVSASGGAGIRAAQFICDQQVDAVISGDFGPNAYDALKQAGVSMYLFGSSRTVQEALENFKAGQMEALTAPVGRGRGRR